MQNLPSSGPRCPAQLAMPSRALPSRWSFATRSRRSPAARPRFTTGSCPSCARSARPCPTSTCSTCRPIGPRRTACRSPSSLTIVAVVVTGWVNPIARLAQPAIRRRPRRSSSASPAARLVVAHPARLARRRRQSAVRHPGALAVQRHVVHLGRGRLSGNRASRPALGVGDARSIFRRRSGRSR